MTAPDPRTVARCSVRPTRKLGAALAAALLLQLAEASALEPAGEPQLARYLVGAAGDAAVARGGGVLLVGGGDPPTESLRWMLEQASAGDVVVLGASGGRGFDAELQKSGPLHSVRSFVLNGRGRPPIRRCCGPSVARKCGRRFDPSGRCRDPLPGQGHAPTHRRS
ncbi:MAG: hypothetical protein HY814_02275 [Candidatus Riflebacteria bacterium]|nr:hypothetical protein [Candidatus Riflebacteria bacterium]